MPRLAAVGRVSVLLSILRAAGLSLKEFGQKGGHVTDGLGAIEA